MEVNNFNIVSPSGISKRERIIEGCRNDLIKFGKTFLPGDFTKKSTTPEFHYHIAASLLDDSTNKQLAIIVPRGHGKSTLVKAYILHQFLYNAIDPKANPLFFGWVSDCRDKSILNLDGIATHLAMNPRIHQYFGYFVGDTWNKLEIKLKNRSTLVSRSNAKGIRGENITSVMGGAQRFNRIFLDDMESQKNTITYESREYIKKGVNEEIYPALTEGNSRLVFTGTPVHPDSLCQNILDGYKRSLEKPSEGDYSWEVITYKATQPNMEGGVLWHSWMPRETLELKRKFSIDTTGSDRGYYQEYELEAATDEERIWTRDHYHLHDAEYVWDENLKHNFIKFRGELIPVKIYIGCDPATDIETRTSDFTAIQTIAYDGKRIFLLDEFIAKSISQLARREANGELAVDSKGELVKLGVVDVLFNKYERYHADKAIVEDVAMTRGIWQDIEKEKKRRGVYYDFYPIEPNGKEKRNKIVRGLSTYFNHGQIFVREHHWTTREQIEGMSASMSHDDAIEAFFFAVAFLSSPILKRDERGRYKLPVREKIKRSWKTL